METIGSFEAKTHWSALLNKVSLGEEIIITKRGKAIARLIPELNIEEKEIDKAIAELKLLRETTELGMEDWKLLRDEGRK